MQIWASLYLARLESGLRGLEGGLCGLGREALLLGSQLSMPPSGRLGDDSGHSARRGRDLRAMGRGSSWSVSRLRDEDHWGLAKSNCRRLQGHWRQVASERPQIRVRRHCARVGAVSPCLGAGRHIHDIVRMESPERVRDTEDPARGDQSRGQLAWDCTGVWGTAGPQPVA